MINQVRFDDIRDLWHRVLVTNSIQAPFLTWEWHNNWFRLLSEKSAAFTLVIDDSVIAPFARSGDSVTFSGGDEIADYLDIIGPDEKKQIAWDLIIPYLKESGVKNILLRNVPENSTTLKSAKNYGAEIIAEDTTPLMQLPDSWETYTESLSKKYRHELERKIRKFSREHIDAQITDSPQPDKDIGILFSLMEKDEAKKLFLTPKMKEFFMSVCTTFPENVNLKYISLGDKHISAILAFRTDTAYYLYNSGFDKDCCNIAGFYLKAMSIQYAINQKIPSYNFLQGNERYKYELGGNDFNVYTVTIRI